MAANDLVPPDSKPGSQENILKEHQVPDKLPGIAAEKQELLAEIVSRLHGIPGAAINRLSTYPG